MSDVSQRLLVPVFAALAAFCGACGNPTDPGDGEIRVIVTTTGVDLDSTGYRLTIGTQSVRLSVNDTVIVRLLEPTSVGLISEVAVNCDVDGNNEFQLDRAEDGGNTILFQIFCHELGLFAFEGRSDASGINLFTVRETGAELNRLHFAENPVGFFGLPQWSPDGSLLLFGDIDNIFIASGDGSGFTRLTADGQHEHIEGRSWSPDGSQIAFKSRGQTNTTDLYVVRADGTNLKNLTQSGPADFDQVEPFDPTAWSPDGSTIFYSSHTSGNDTWDLVSISVADGSIVPLFADSFTNRMPSWAPTGAAIAFARGGIGQSLTIHVASSEGVILGPVTTDFTGHSHPVWSPDGTQIVFHGWYENETQVIVGDLEGNTNRIGAGFMPTWSPDGGRIAYSASVDGESVIAVVNLSHGSSAQLLVGEGFSRIRSVSWKP